MGYININEMCPTGKSIAEEYRALSKIRCNIHSQSLGKKVSMVKIDKLFSDKHKQVKAHVESCKECMAKAKEIEY